jgi:hypothetical protein
MFDSFHVPLVDENNNFLLLSRINLSENALILSVNENSFEFGEENVHVLDVPVDLVLVKTLFSILRWLSVLKSDFVLLSFCPVEDVAQVLESFVEIVRQVHSGFVDESVPSWLVQLWSQEVSLCSTFLSFFESKFDFKTWFQEGEGGWDAEVQPEESAVDVKSKPEDHSS